MRKAFSIFLSLLVLLSSTGVAMTTHYCGGYAMDMELALGHVHLDCGMENMDSPVCPGHDASLKEKSCCDNVSISSQTDHHNIQISKSLISEFAIAFAYTSLELFQAEGDNNTTYHNYSPPLLKQDIPVLHQSFLL